jgi:hypothetical protein
VGLLLRFAREEIYKLAHRFPVEGFLARDFQTFSTAAEKRLGSLKTEGFLDTSMFRCSIRTMKWKMLLRALCIFEDGLAWYCIVVVVVANEL